MDNVNTDDDDDLLDILQDPPSSHYSDNEVFEDDTTGHHVVFERSKSVPLDDSRSVRTPINNNDDDVLYPEFRKSLPNLTKKRNPSTLLFYKRSTSTAYQSSFRTKTNIKKPRTRAVSGPSNLGCDSSTSLECDETALLLPDSSQSQDNESESTDDLETSPKGFFRSLTRRQAFILATLSLGDFSSYVCLSLLAPFFPLEAQMRGISTTTSGWIFGVFALVQVVASPIAGKLMGHTGARFMFLAGLFFAAGCNGLFGVLEWVPVEDGGFAFITMCFIIRIFLALGCTAYSTASFALCATEFDDNVTTVFGILETVIGVGMMVGPALGGVLYEAGGFSVPFLATSGFMLAIVPVAFYLLPHPDEDVNDGKEEVRPSLLFKSVAFYVISFDVVVSAVLWSVLDPLLEPHLEQFGLSTDVVGLLFLLMSGVYAVLSPVWGWVADHMDDSKPLLFVGFIFSGLGLWLLGPSPVFGITDGPLWLNIVALVVLGSAISLASVPTFDAIICIAEDVGLPDNLGTYALIAGVWSSAFSLGDFIGPSFGGSLQDAAGFPMTMTYTGLLSVLAGLITLVMYIVERYCMRKSNISLANTSEENLRIEVTPLLNDTDELSNTLERQHHALAAKESQFFATIS